jgi:ribosomal protein S18 acetylase RimI-like enzyme
MNELTIKILSTLSVQDLELISRLESQVFKTSMSVEEYQLELRSKFGILAQIAYMGDEPCGYKIGYEQSPKKFYSWVGGVLPKFRNQGIAKAMMEQQHKLVREKGYLWITTQTKNSFKEMLILNIRSGFEIIGVRKSLGSEEQAILLEKRLA